MLPQTLSNSEEKKQESRDAQKVLKLLAKKLKPLGFERTKPTFFTRSAQYVVEFVHVHKVTFAPKFKVHLGIRVRSDDFSAAHLNGINSDSLVDPTMPNCCGNDFSFTPSEVSFELCSEAMLQFVASEGIRWFESFTNVTALLSSDSPLSPLARTALQIELEESFHDKVSEATQRVLNPT